MRRCRSCAGRILPRAGFVTRSTIEAAERGNNLAARDRSEIVAALCERRIISATPNAFGAAAELDTEPNILAEFTQQNRRLRLYLPLGLRFEFARQKKQSRRT